MTGLRNFRSTKDEFRFFKKRVQPSTLCFSCERGEEEDCVHQENTTQAHHVHQQLGSNHLGACHFTLKVKE